MFFDLLMTLAEPFEAWGTPEKMRGGRWLGYRFKKKFKRIYRCFVGLRVRLVRRGYGTTFLQLTHIYHNYPLSYLRFAEKERTLKFLI